MVMAAALLQTAEPQQTTQTNEPSRTTDQQDSAAQPHGHVLFHGTDQGETGTDTGGADASAPATVAPAASAASSTPATQAALAGITDTQRSALVFTARDLDLHVTPGSSQMTARARFTVRNQGSEPLRTLTVQLSSSLSWESFALNGKTLSFTQHRMATDADHTGEVTEALVTLPEPLAAGASVTLTGFYAGAIVPSAVRLTRIGAPPEQASRIDWDAIDADGMALRGFGNAIWYPVSSPALFLGDGAKLFQAVGAMRAAEAGSSFALRLAVDYTGEPPVAVFMNGRRLTAEHVTEEPNMPVAESHGVATVASAAAPLGFRTPSLFVSWHEPRPSDDLMIEAVTERPEAVTPYNTAAHQLEPLLQLWLGPTPLQPLNLFDHAGQPFEDDALLVAPLTETEPLKIAPTLVHSLAHAWFHSSLPWLNEGVPQFLAVVEAEATAGRDISLASLRAMIVPLTLMEPEPAVVAKRATPLSEQTPAPITQQTPLPFDPRNLPGPPISYTGGAATPAAGQPSADQPKTAAAPEKAAPSPIFSSSTDSGAAPADADKAASGDTAGNTASNTTETLPAMLTPPAGQPGQSLIAAHDEVYYRAKAAAVLVMLRSLTSDEAMQHALKQYRELARRATPAQPEDPTAFERLLEQASGRSLRWVFDDWVYNDRGLADLSIQSVTPRSLTAKNGKDVSWLVAVEVHNQGNVNVEVPVTVRSGKLTTTERVRIGPQASVTTRILFGGVPDEVLVNDGSIPETVAPLHRYRLHVVDEQDTTQPAAPSTTP